MDGGRAAGPGARGAEARPWLRSLTREGLCEPGGDPTVKAINWGYARLTDLADAVRGAPVARWHTRRCMRLVGQEPTAGGTGICC